MRNLLLEKDKKAIRREYLLRVITVALLFVLFSALLGIVFLLPSYFLSETKERAITEQHAIIERSIAVREGEASLNALLEANDKLDLLAPPEGHVALSDLLAAVISALPSGITLSEFSYTAHADRGSELHLSGIAETREDLLTFQNTLRSVPFFDSVALPVSDLAADRDLSFTVTLGGSF